jgi:hypothetical protein
MRPTEISADTSVRFPLRQIRATTSLPVVFCFKYLARGPGRSPWSDLDPQHPINTGPSDTKTASNIDRTNTIGLQRYDLGGASTCGWLPTPVSAFGFGFCDPFPLALQHKLPFKAPHGTNDRENELSGGGAGVGSQVQDAEVGTLRLYAVGDLEQVLRRASQPVELGDNE